MREHLMERAQALAARLPHMGVGPDLATMTLAELWGLCCYLQRLADL
jgi:hypothetical protein